ncbi:MAG: energy transducer TonB [Undibacterium sp.]|nr:energy transducer TonB [Undibacterium sp.]
MVKLFLSILLLSFSFMVHAVEVPAVMDQKTCKFTYPKGALLNEEEGVVTIVAVVNASGGVDSTKVISGSGSKSLDKATLEAINSCKFKPGTVDGKPATTNVTIVYAWKLSTK